jgi:hypothetical protein
VTSDSGGNQGGPAFLQQVNGALGFGIPPAVADKVLANLGLEIDFFMQAHAGFVCFSNGNPLALAKRTNSAMTSSDEF